MCAFDDPVKPLTLNSQAFKELCGYCKKIKIFNICLDLRSPYYTVFFFGTGKNRFLSASNRIFMSLYDSQAVAKPLSKVFTASAMNEPRE